VTSSCPCCASTESKLLFSGLGDRLFHTTEETFDLRECANCQVIFLSPAPTGPELARFYPAGYWWQTTAAPQRVRLWHRLLEIYRRVMMGGHVRRIKRLAGDCPQKAGRLLDVGCGDGVFLAACYQLPLVRVGLDQSLDALRAAKQCQGLELVQSNVDALPFADESFAIITMFHVLEHIPTPHRSLQELRRLLQPEGRLVVQVPNVASLQKRLLGQRWAGLDVPRHLANYSPPNLRTLLERNGFRVIRESHFSLRDNPAIPVMSLFPRLYPPSRRLIARGDSGARPWVNSLLDLAFLLLVVLTVPFAMLESLMQRGGTIVVEAGKK
jgi:2-polyprenyl-3-methyl-5-hydroxy-6-metoxy-1,4-benzoquinol methylase